MEIARKTAVSLASCAGLVAAAGACHYFNLGDLPGLLGTGIALAGAATHAVFGEFGAKLLRDAADRVGEESARGVENHDLHRLIGLAIARVLEREAEGTAGKEGAEYLRQAAAAFRDDRWMGVELTGAVVGVSEPNITAYFTGDTEKIKHTPVLEREEWVELIRKVGGSSTLDRALDYAADNLRDGFAAEMWEAAKDAWKKNDLAWPALNLRLLGLILDRVGVAAGQADGIREEIAKLRTALGKAADEAESTGVEARDKVLKDAIRQYQDDLNAKLDRNFQRVFDQLAEIKAALDYPRTAPVKEPLINLPNTTKEILARHREARQLLEALRREGPGIVSVAAPPGFGKSAIFALALRIALPNGDARDAGLDGIAVLNAKAAAPGIASFAGLLGGITGLQEIAKRFTSTAEPTGSSLRGLFFEFLSLAGKVWLVVENAEEVLAASAENRAAADFRDLLTAWCKAGHQAKLLLLTRYALHPAPECHRGMTGVEKALLGGLPEDAAVELLRQRLADTRFHSTAESLLRQIVEKLYRVPMALEQFAGYLHWKEQGVEINQEFLDHNDLLRLRASERMEDFLLRVIGETLKLLDAPSLNMLRVAGWAGISVPLSGLMALQEDGAATLTRLVRSNLLLAHEGTAAEGRSFDVHPLIGEALTEFSGSALDFSRIARIFMVAGNSEWEKTQFRPALPLYLLAERAARVVEKRDQVAGAIVNRGNTLGKLGRMEEAVVAYDESIAMYRVLVENEHRLELRNALAGAIMDRGTALHSLGRLEEAVAVYEESIAIRRVLVKDEDRLALRNSLAKAIMNRGVALGNLGRPEEAVVACEESIAMYRVLVENEHRLELRDDLGRAIMNRGNVLADLGRLEEAVAAHEESIAMYRVLVEDEHRLELRNNLARAMMNLGPALAELGRVEEAVAPCEESIAIYRVLVGDEHRLELRNDLAKTYHNLSLAREKQGDLPAALESARQARQLREHLAEEGMKHLEREFEDTKRLEARLMRPSLRLRFHYLIWSLTNRRRRNTT